MLLVIHTKMVWRLRETHIALIDIVSPLRQQAHLDQRATHLAVHSTIKASGALARSAGTRHIAGHLGVDGLAEQRGRSGVDDGLERSAAIVRDNVEDSRDVAAGADLRECVAALLHRIFDIVELIVAISSNAAFSETKVVVGVDIFGPEDGGLDFSHAVLALAWDDAAFDAKSGTIATLTAFHISIVYAVSAED